MTLIKTKYIGIRIYSETTTLILKYTHMTMENLFPRKSLLNFIHGDMKYTKNLFVEWIF
jgi:hypothetical protein